MLSFFSLPFLSFPFLSFPFLFFSFLFFSIYLFFPPSLPLLFVFDLTYTSMVPEYGGRKEEVRECPLLLDFRLLAFRLLDFRLLDFRFLDFRLSIFDSTISSVSFSFSITWTFEHYGWNAILLFANIQKDENWKLLINKWRYVQFTKDFSCHFLLSSFFCCYCWLYSPTIMMVGWALSSLVLVCIHDTYTHHIHLCRKYITCSHHHHSFHPLIISSTPHLCNHLY